jgi:hypothetical protein
MSRFLDDRTWATDPGSVALSHARLAEVQPELLTNRTFRCGPVCAIEHPAAEMRERFAEHLRLGDSRAAVVVSIAPLVVAAYSSDLDACVLATHPSSLVEKHGLEVGSRLLTVNIYARVSPKSGGERLYAADLLPGPARTGWSNFTPLIADFLSDDGPRIEARKRAIAEKEWQRLEECARERIARFGLDTARDGRPTRVATPVRIDGLPYYVTIHREAVEWDPSGKPTPARANASDRAPYALVALLVIVLLALWALVRASGR